MRIRLLISLKIIDLVLKKINIEEVIIKVNLIAAKDFYDKSDKISKK